MKGTHSCWCYKNINIFSSFSFFSLSSLFIWVEIEGKALNKSVHEVLHGMKWDMFHGLQILLHCCLFGIYTKRPHERSPQIPCSVIYFVIILEFCHVLSQHWLRPTQIPHNLSHNHSKRGTKMHLMIVLALWHCVYYTSLYYYRALFGLTQN